MPNAPEHKGGSVAWQWMVLRLVQKLNAPSSIVSREAGRVSSVNFVQLEKASRLIFFILLGIFREERLLQLSNNSAPISSASEGNSIVFKLIQFQKVRCPKFMILSGIEIEVRL